MRPLLLLVFIVALGEAIRLHSGAQDPVAYLSLALALLSIAAALFLPRAALALPAAARALALLALAALVLQGWQLVAAPPEWALRDGGRVFRVLAFFVIACAVAAAAGLSGPARTLRIAAWLVPAAVLALAVYVVHATPDPWIDVYLVHVESFRDLLAGRSPFGQTRPNLYFGYANLHFYPAEILSADGRRIQLGFPYPPLQLLLTLPGHLVAGDYRYVQALALGASGALMMLARPGRIALAAGAIFLLTPNVLATMEGSWTEPMVVLMLSLTLFCAARARRHLWWALGALFAIKQYTILLLPLTPLLLQPRERDLRGLVRLLGPALAVAASIDLPFFLWNPRGFLHDVVVAPSLQPVRLDSLSWLALAARSGAAWPRWVPFAVLAAALAAGLLRAERSVRGFAAAAALASCAVFAFARQAFANYYVFPLGAGAWALALEGEPEATTAQTAQTANQVS